VDIQLISTSELADELITRFDRCLIIVQDKAEKTGTKDVIAMYASPPDQTIIQGLLAQAKVITDFKMNMAPPPEDT